MRSICLVLYLDVQADGTYRGQVPTAAGNLFVRAEVKKTGRSADAWLVFRARGDLGSFPILTQAAVTSSTLPALLS